MSIEDQLLQLARDREKKSQSTLEAMFLERPDLLRRELRAYMSRQVDYRRMSRTDERVPMLTTKENRINELDCPGAEFLSGSRLTFKIQVVEEQRGWLVKCFQYHLQLSPERGSAMLRIHLNDRPSHDPLRVPRCHLHIGGSEAHVPFPIMDPRLILHVICEHIEPDLGA